MVVLEHDPQIELAHAHARQRDERIGLGDGHLDIGPTRGEARQRSRDDAHGRSRIRPDSQGRRRAVELPQISLGLCELLEDHLGVLDEPPAGGCQPHAARAALEQRDPRLDLELDQLLGDRGRREAKRLGGGGDRAA